MQATKKQRKRVPAGQPAWEEWVSREGQTAQTSKEINSLHPAIANLAYSYWEARGRQGGSAEEDWLVAEQMIQLKTARQ